MTIPQEAQQTHTQTSTPSGEGKRFYFFFWGDEEGGCKEERGIMGYDATNQGLWFAPGCREPIATREADQSREIRRDEDLNGIHRRMK